MRTTFNAGHDHSILGRVTTVDDGHSHGIEVGSHMTTVNSAPGGVPHRHSLLAKSPTGEKPRTGYAAERR